jgi:hypothetical protein
MSHQSTQAKIMREKRQFFELDMKLHLHENKSHTYQIYEVQLFEPSQSQGSKQHGVVKIAIHIVSLACALLLFLGPVKAQKAGH